MNSHAITLDIDWAPDWAIDYVASILIEEQVKATWFVRHDSPVIQRLKSEPLFELGLHPNFAEGSTQGPNPTTIMQTLTTILPEARLIRMHGLYQSSSLLATLARDKNFEVAGNKPVFAM